MEQFLKYVIQAGYRPIRPWNPSQKEQKQAREELNRNEVAEQNYDGHLTIMRFTTCWKAMFGTPNLDIDGREEVSKLPKFSSLEDALRSIIIHELEK